MERTPAGAGNGAVTSVLHIERLARAGPDRRRFGLMRMRTFATILSLLFSLSGFSAEMKQGFLFRGDWYQMEAKLDLFTNVPSWNPLTQPNPPLAAARALERATNFIAEIKKDDGWSFHLDRLSLVQHGSFWIWEAQWSYLRDTVEYQKGFDKMGCWILMDGTLVKPVRMKKPVSRAEDGAANRSQPIRSETNSTSAAAGSRR